MNSAFEILTDLHLEEFEKELIYNCYCDYNEQTREGISFREWCAKHSLLTDEEVLEKYQDYAEIYDPDFFNFEEICTMMISENRELPLQKISNELYLEGGLIL